MLNPVAQRQLPAARSTRRAPPLLHPAAPLERGLEQPVNSNLLIAEHSLVEVAKLGLSVALQREPQACLECPACLVWAALEWAVWEWGWA